MFKGGFKTTEMEPARSADALALEPSASKQATSISDPVRSWTTTFGWPSCHRTVARQSQHRGMDMPSGVPFMVDDLMPARRSLRVAVVTETYPPEINGVAATISRVVEGLRGRKATKCNSSGPGRTAAKPPPTDRALRSC
jgi:hypothetical protein